MAKMLYIEPSKCTGCRTCELVCSIKNEGMANPSLARIQVIAYKNRGIRVPLTCQQCEDPACSAVCPTKALTRNHGQGVVNHDKNKCIGCKVCVTACPFGAITFNTNSRQIYKCEQCDGKPECVRFCEDKAITFVETDAISGKKRRQTVQDLSRLLERYATR
jgi:Fe-S-cluster-containing hydrogenase component 2